MALSYLNSIFTLTSSTQTFTRLSSVQENSGSVHSRRRNVTTSMVGLKTVTYAKISPKVVNPRDLAGERRRKRRRRSRSI